MLGRAGQVGATQRRPHHLWSHQAPGHHTLGGKVWVTVSTTRPVARPPTFVNSLRKRWSASSCMPTGAASAFSRSTPSAMALALAASSVSRPTAASSPSLLLWLQAPQPAASMYQSQHASIPRPPPPSACGRHACACVCGVDSLFQRRSQAAIDGSLLLPPVDQLLHGRNALALSTTSMGRAICVNLNPSTPCPHAHTSSGVAYLLAQFIKAVHRHLP